MEVQVFKNIVSGVLKKFIEHLVMVPKRKGLFWEIQVIVPLVGAYPVLEVRYETSRLPGIGRPGTEVGQYVTEYHIGGKPVSKFSHGLIICSTEI
jgi:hypothetical protein